MSAFATNGENSGRSAGAKFPRSLHLLRHTDFRRVYDQGRRVFSAHMTVFYRRRENGEGLRVGFTVSRVLGGAVERNRVKRRLREAVRLRRQDFREPVDVVINPKKSVLKADFGELLAEVEKAFQTVRQRVESSRKGG